MWFLEDRPRACQVTIRVHVVLRFSGRRVFFAFGAFREFPISLFRFLENLCTTGLTDAIFYNLSSDAGAKG